MTAPTDCMRRVPDIDIRALATLARNRNVSTPCAVTFRDGAIIDLIDLVDPDPVHSMYGWIAPPDATAVGFCAPATVRREPPHQSPSDELVTHVLTSSGCAVTLLGSSDVGRWFGPTTEPQRGRVPDLCRRALGLATEPPSEAMTDFVLRAWLDVVVRHSLEGPDIDWEAIVDLHPAACSLPRPTTPAMLAIATASLGEALDWERFRVVIATVGGFPFGEDAAPIAAWMDSGMFSRWALECLPTRDDALDALESVLGPSTFDRLWVAVSLSGRPETPEHHR